MKRLTAQSGSRARGARSVAVFSLAEARRALPYVARIARDAAEAFRVARECRAALAQERHQRTIDLLSQQRDDALQRLNAAIDECNQVGVDLVDIPNGAVRFNILHEGQTLERTWRMEDPVENAWAEPVGAGAAS